MQRLHIAFATDGGDVTAVNDVSLSVDSGEVLAIVGESGSGKTVTAKSIIGLLPETAVTRGVIVLNDRDVVGLTGAALRATRGADAAMVFQEPSTSLNPVYTVGWQIMEGIRAHEDKLSRKEAKAKALEMLTRVGIPDPEQRFNFYPHQFSGRPEAAHRHRDGARARSRADHRGRTDNGPRRDRAGGDPRPAAPLP